MTTVPSELLASPFPAGVGFVLRGLSRTDRLLPEEEGLLSPRATSRRAEQLRSGRSAAREALALAGFPPGPVLASSSREPLWPTGVVGTITHKRELVAAAAAPRELADGLGLDLESLEHVVSPQVEKLICTATEQAWVREAASETQARWRMRALFSAKESLFKAVFPLQQVWLGFRDAELEWSPEESAFHARLGRGAADHLPAGSSLAVRCRTAGAWILTSLMLPARPV